MHNTDSRNGLVRAAAVMLFTFGADAYAVDCAAGGDATGNDCTGGQATNSVSQANSRLLYLQGAAAMASLRLEQAKQRQGAATDAVEVCGGGPQGGPQGAERSGKGGSTLGMSDFLLASASTSVSGPEFRYAARKE